MTNAKIVLNKSIDNELRTINEIIRIINAGLRA